MVTAALRPPSVLLLADASQLDGVFVCKQFLLVALRLIIN
jgi:hypothetical protein